MVDLDFFSKIAIPLAAMFAAAMFQLPAMRKGWDEVRHLRRDRRKREAEFAAKFYEQSGDARVKQYADDLSYAALIGDNHLNTDERRFLLALKNPEKAIDRYLKTFPYVQIQLTEMKLAWRKKRYASKAYRAIMRIAYLIGYMAFAFFAGLPVLLRDSYDPLHKLSSTALFVPILYCVGFGLPLAVICLRRSFLVGAAEQLIESQSVIADGQPGGPQIARLRAGAAAPVGTQSVRSART